MVFLLSYTCVVYMSSRILVHGDVCVVSLLYHRHRSFVLLLLLHYFLSFFLRTSILLVVLPRTAHSCYNLYCTYLPIYRAQLQTVFALLSLSLFSLPLRLMPTILPSHMYRSQTLLYYLSSGQDLSYPILSSILSFILGLYPYSRSILSESLRLRMIVTHTYVYSFLGFHSPLVCVICVPLR